MNVVLLTGGPSAEREVALASGKGILGALRSLGHQVTVIDPAYPESTSEDDIFRKIVSRQSPSKEELLKLQSDAGSNLINLIASDKLAGIDIVFLGLHGKFGEDGKIQNLLDLKGIPYTGSGMLASAICLDKDIAKIILSNNGVPTPKWITLNDKDNIDTESIFSQVQENFGNTCVIKPNDEGSTIGMSILNDSISPEFIEEKIKQAFFYSGKVLIEEFVKGREFTVPVLGDEPYPVVEIVPKGGFYDYEHKYTKGMTTYVCPAEISKETTLELQYLALKAHRSTGCEVYSRVDFIMDTTGAVKCLEVNTLPGMTETSLVPKSAAASGMDFPALIQKIIELSLSGNK